MSWGIHDVFKASLGYTVKLSKKRESKREKERRKEGRKEEGRKEETKEGRNSISQHIFMNSISMNNQFTPVKYKAVQVILSQACV